MKKNMQRIWRNPRYRYGNYMEAIEKMTLDESVKTMVLSCFLRLAQQCECNNESSRAEYELWCYMEEIRNGKYGVRQQEHFCNMSEQKQKRVATYMRLQEQTGASVTLYGKAMIGMLEDGVLYMNRRNPSELLLYLGKTPNQEEESIIAFVNAEFLPFGYQLRIYDEASFGIIGDDRCMTLNQIRIY